MQAFEEDLAEVLAHFREFPGVPRPVTLTEEFLRAMARVEALPCNQPGQDKSWVLRVERHELELRATIQRPT